MQYYPTQPTVQLGPYASAAGFQGQAALPPSKYFSIDCEAVATGPTHLDRAVAQISLVDQYEQCLLNVYIKPEKPVASYLTPLTGLTRDTLEQQGVSLQQGLSALRNLLPKDAILVGQNIRQDVQWLGLREGQDFASMQDLSGLYRVFNEQYHTWSVFGQDHVAQVLLGWHQGAASHDAVMDAVKSIRLFNLYHQLQSNPPAWEQAKAALLATPPQPSFAKKNPTWDGVCMGNRKTCKCGAPFFG